LIRTLDYDGILWGLIRFQHGWHEICYEYLAVRKDGASWVLLSAVVKPAIF